MVIEVIMTALSTSIDALAPSATLPDLQIIPMTRENKQQRLLSALFNTEFSQSTLELPFTVPQRTKASMYRALAEVLGVRNLSLVMHQSSLFITEGQLSRVVSLVGARSPGFEVWFDHVGHMIAIENGYEVALTVR
jgi:hypothetical protein